MKKITLSIFVLLFVAASYNALAINTFYQEHFTSGIPAGWSNVDTSAAATGVIWTYTTTGASRPAGGLDNFLNSTTATDGYVILDGDSAGNILLAPQKAFLTTAAINCTGKLHVHLTFEEYFAQYGSSQGIVSVSNDSVTWTDVHHAETGLGQDQSTSNPNALDIDISSVADNQATVYIRFNYNGSFDYFWMLDDITLYENPSFDGGVVSIDTPVTACDTFSMTNVVITIRNFGGDTLFNTPVNYWINGVGPVLDTCRTAIAPTSSFQFTFSTPAILIPGVNSIIAYTSIPGDLTASNDTATKVIFKGPHVVGYNGLTYTDGFETPIDLDGWMAIDGNTDGITWGTTSLLPHTGNQAIDYTSTTAADDWFFSPCLLMEQNPSDSIYSLSFYYRTFSPSFSANMEVSLFMTQDTSMLVSNIVPITAVSFAGNIYIQGTQNFSVAVPGLYYLGFHVTGSSDVDLRIDDINLVMTRNINLSPLTSKSSEVGVYPNPNSGLFYLTNLSHSFGSNSPVQVKVFDVVGNVVYSQTVSSDRLTIDLANQKAGIYMVRLSNDREVITKMVSVTK